MLEASENKNVVELSLGACLGRRSVDGLWLVVLCSRTRISFLYQ